MSEATPDTVTIPRELVLALIDMALTGDSGMSGWMDDEEVTKLRAAAEAAGMDPLEATPRNFRCKYRGSHVLRDKDWYRVVRGPNKVVDVRRCTECHHWEERPHVATERHTDGEKG